jgi:hypothetical protein
MESRQTAVDAHRTSRIPEHRLLETVSLLFMHVLTSGVPASELANGELYNGADFAAYSRNSATAAMEKVGLSREEHVK